MKKTIFSVTAALCAAAVLSACGNDGGTKITKGNSSKLDTLSYALGANIGYGVKGEFSDIPFDYKTITKGLDEAALEKSELSHEDALNQLRDYFMTKRAERAQAVYAKRAQADSIRLAGGDSTKVEHPAADPSMFESEQERYDLSYAFGNDIGNNIKDSNLPLQLTWLDAGFLDAQEGNAKMDEMEVANYLQNYFAVVLPAKNAAASEKWLAKIEKKSGVKKTESGLLYKIERKGEEGTEATDDRDIVVVKYEGTNREGKVFDSSYQRAKEVEEQIAKIRNDNDLSDEQKVERIDRLEHQLNRVATAEFPLNRVIKGWTEGMKLVGKGGKITLWIPSELAYGSRGAGRDIGGNEALKFEVEIVDVKPFAKPEPAEETPADAE